MEVNGMKKFDDRYNISSAAGNLCFSNYSCYALGIVEAL